jgi:hypothetical protein
MKRQRPAVKGEKETSPSYVRMFAPESWQTNLRRRAMATVEGVRLAKTISSSSRFAMKSKARTKTRPCSSQFGKTTLIGGYF